MLSHQRHFSDKFDASWGPNNFLKNVVMEKGATYIFFLDKNYRSISVIQGLNVLMAKPYKIRTGTLN